jgi:uncharacterized protein (TIGR00255 family)
MTGFGKSERQSLLGKVAVLAYSLNHRFLEIILRLPEDLLEFEAEIRKMVQKKIKRGRVNLSITYEPGRGRLPRVELNSELAKGYYQQFQSLKRELGLKEDIGLRDIVSLPEVVKLKRSRIDKEALLPDVRKAVDRALEALLLAKEQEGRQLYKDLCERLKRIKALLSKIERRQPEIIRLYEKKLLRQARAGGNERAERIKEEIAAFSKSCDISEELVRMKAHLKVISKLFACRREAGRHLDFIAQELQRESNTIGAKTPDYWTSRWIIQAKAEIEKIREQVQNVE